MSRNRIGLFSAFFISVLALLGWSAAAETVGDAASLLKQVSQTYANLRSYHFEGATVLRTESGSTRHEQETPFVVAEVRPARVRLETKSSLMSTLVVSDGETTWTYMPRLHEYTRVKTPPATVVAAQAALLRKQNPIAEYERLVDYAPVAKLIREEAVVVSGREYACWVVELPGSPASASGVQNFPRLLWIDKDRRLVLRDAQSFKIKRPYTAPSDQIRTCTFSLARVNEPLPDSLFQFTPPADAVEVSELSLGSSRLAFSAGNGLKARVSTSRGPAGAPASSPALPSEESPLTAEGSIQAAPEAPDFTLSALQGGEVRLRDLRGKIVLLDFWATWCGPCRRELPVIEKLHRDYRRKGLVVLGVNNENAETSQRYVQANGYSFPTLVDSRREVHRSYGIKAIPTVYVIDKRGRVAARFVGARQEPELLGALRQAGLE